MAWMRTPYFWALLFASIIFAGVIIFQGRTANAPAAITAWSGAGTISDTYPYNAAPVENVQDAPQTSPGLLQDVTNSAPFSYILPLNASRVSTEDSGSAVRDAYGGAIPQPTTLPSGKITPAADNSGFLDPYSFIPRGLISITEPAAARNPAQQAIFDYGNRIGSHIQSFENVHRNMPQILKDFFDDRASQTKAEKVLSIARDYEKLAQQLANTGDVPKEASALHAALAQGYGTVAEGLANLTKTQDDKGLVNAVLAYDASADEFVKNYVALSRFFGTYGVKFSGSDAGSVFMFNANNL
ncbi:hypothetical protein A3F27_03435 [Candidatus Kaiserbacteria bacterium RIFCSPHIGHO2_12_FULL_53_13]|uniref:Uncharacterized protein n=1 Tax=Candidatus Kaiserbacteria bacterium RIFCSPHIGHO2_12_FULL_53_13 TaxID=1798502 RepID=A0A1F6E608_9BACT|nr:MAG: hypothetical protein A3F27_03435 [Candidatus Kaiserbacteria bacterium RIFCSPHIGHO2_12_FULL_53_13]OGG74390.1 MAG: hypothetical protein A3A37_00280 [Candidatus Kaiserbacteria bacterium RIFCSPLOWO2_01_FULL_52_36]